MKFGSDSHIFRLAEKTSRLILSGITAGGRREVEVGTLLLGNDKNNVIVDKVLSSF